MEAWRTAIPIAWALVSTGIGLALYKSSKAFFAQSSNSSTETKQLRLVGSVAIAAVAFFGMWYTTPEQLVTGLPSDQLLVSKGLLEQFESNVSSLSRAFDELDVCRSIAPTQECTAELSALSKQMQITRESVAAIQNSR